MGYSCEKNVQILLAVLRANGIKKVVVSPGATNISIVYSMLYDGGFEMYSAIDERGAAYIACGLASESGEPVVITCTGATASRNYFPGLTEAYHRKLPVLAVTASQDFIRCNNLSPQFIDRNGHPNDSLRASFQVPVVRSDADERVCTLKINKAVLELFRRGGGPVHINLASEYSNDFSVTELPKVQIIRRYGYEDQLPKIKHGSRVAIIIGNHQPMSERLTKAIDHFCEVYDAAAIVDHSSHYWGKYRVLPTILTTQEKYKTNLFDVDLLIHIGQEHGDYYTEPYCKRVKEVWRINEDGEIRDTFGKLTNVFEMKEEAFFENMVEGEKNTKKNMNYYRTWKEETAKLYAQIPDLPLSNIWLAQQIISRFPTGSCLELGVSNTMRAWTFFDFKHETYVLANTGCRGIDGAIPTLVGMSLVHPDKMHYAVMGDLTFFYSFNILCNRHVGKNIRILLINNGTGAEFNLYHHRAYNVYHGDPEMINLFTGGGGHNGQKSRNLVKHYAEDLGFMYITASTKEEALKMIDIFLDEEYIDKPILFEVFTNPKEESDALRMIRGMKTDKAVAVKGMIKSMLGR